MEIALLISTTQTGIAVAVFYPGACVWEYVAGTLKYFCYFPSAVLHFICDRIRLKIFGCKNEIHVPTVMGMIYFAVRNTEQGALPQTYCL